MTRTSLKLKAAGVNFYDVTKTALPPLPPLKVKTPTPVEYDSLDDTHDEDETEAEESLDYF